MRVPRHYTPITVLVIVTLFLQPMLQELSLAPMAPAWLHSFAAPIAKAQSDGQVYLPVISSSGSSTATPTPTATPATPPSFVIMAPTEGSTVAGTINFAIQPLNAISITSVSFQAGNTQLGVDNTPGDGFRVFVNTKTLAAGNQQFTAMATGPSGSTTQSVTVNVVPNPPSAATIGNQGGVLATARGSIISILPNSVPPGTAITVTEMTQSEVQLQNGINWEKIGVTFLGAQKIDSTAPFSRPLGMVASAGFGNRVQPGQAVVNYRLAPDADGDGVDEIVVVNTASVAPNGDVIADPVPRPSVKSVQTRSQMTSTKAHDFSTELTVRAGTSITLEVTGFNPNSVFGNIAIFRSSIDGTQIELPGSIQTVAGSNITQTFITEVPPFLAVGAAIIALHNKSTGYTTDPIEVNIESPLPLNKPAKDIILDFFVQTIDTLKSSEVFVTSEQKKIRQQVLRQLDETHNEFTDVFDLLQTMPPGVTHDKLTQILNGIALSLQDSQLVSSVFTANLQSLDPVKLINDVSDALGTAGYLTGFAAGLLLAAGPIFAPSAAGLGLAAGIMEAASFGLKMSIPLFGLYNAFNGTPNPNNSTTGMGSAPPPGGNGGGNAGGGGGGSQTLVAANQQATGGIFIKVFSNGTATPFTGMVDPGGYFFVPFIPQDEPFIAVAYDTSTGETRKFKGIGPKTGKSVFMYFDFFNPAPPDITVTNLNDSGVGSLRQAVADAQLGDHIGFAISGTLTLASQIVISKSISIDGPSNDQIVISGNHLTRTFEIAKDATVTLTHLRITDGKALNGGGIYNSGDLTIVDSVLAQNSAIESGGAIYNFGNNNTRSKLTLRNSNVISNSAEHGGGIKNCCNFVYAYTTLTLQESLIAGNTAKFSGGGIALGYETTTQVISSTITQNKTMDESGWGGGLFILEGGAHLISGSQVTENFASGRGGGIATGANITLIDTTVSHNKAASYGGGIAGIGLVVYDLTLIDSTITQNEAMDGNGGGVYDLTNLYAFNSTIANNRAFKQQNSIGGRGGGIVINGDFTILFTTITGNYADVACGGIGRSLPHNPNHTWKASIIAGNSAPANPDYCPGSETNLISLRYNIVGDGTGTGFVNGVNNDQVGVDPLLKPLANNGGNTPTMGLRPTSPAINKIPATDCTDQNGTLVTSDQRGVARPQEGACEVGAYEAP